jgi:hypothetical protein
LGHRCFPQGGSPTLPVTGNASVRTPVMERVCAEWGLNRQSIPGARWSVRQRLAAHARRLDLRWRSPMLRTVTVARPVSKMPSALNPCRTRQLLPTPRMTASSSRVGSTCSGVLHQIDDPFRSVRKRKGLQDAPAPSGSVRGMRRPQRKVNRCGPRESKRAG